VPSSYRLTEQAAADLDNIASYTIERFGLAQARRYSEGLFKVFDLLVTFPLMGLDQRHIVPDMRCIVHASHTIYYLVSGEEIVIVGLLGQGQDPARRFAK
jgi:toxin ParE1/3/4